MMALHLRRNSPLQLIIFRIINSPEWPVVLGRNLWNKWRQFMLELIQRRDNERKESPPLAAECQF